MSTVSAYDAKTHLSALLERARDGESITITKHGHPIARLVPIAELPDPARAVDDLRAFSETVRLDGLSLRDLIEDGRRY
jgi:prevent-host-death family protein